MIPQALCTSLLGCVHLHATFSRKQRLANPAQVSKSLGMHADAYKNSLTGEFDKDFFSKGAQ
jgi:hypothetical protein